MADYRSAEAAAYRKLYKSKVWTKGRLVFLANNPLCTRCQAKGRITRATVVNHIKPHKGDLALFYDTSNFEAVCAPCHDGPIKQAEYLGYSTDIGLDGWPIAPNHPANR